jgi:hypothetical protein
MEFKNVDILLMDQINEVIKKIYNPKIEPVVIHNDFKKEQLTDVIKGINTIYEETKTRPIRVKVNESWLNEQIENKLILVNDNTSTISMLYGLPVEKDNNIKTFEFVYSEEE